MGKERLERVRHTFAALKNESSYTGGGCGAFKQFRRGVRETHLDKGLDLVEDHRLVGELNQGLGHGQGQGAETSSKA